MTLWRRLVKLETAKPKPPVCTTAEMREAVAMLDRIAQAIAKGGEDEAKAREELRHLLPDASL